MELNEALAFIHATDWKGSRLGLERMRELMHRLGNPQDSLKFIHVAGTNGKGSTRHDACLDPDGGGGQRQGFTPPRTLCA